MKYDKENYSREVSYEQRFQQRKMHWNVREIFLEKKLGTLFL